ncbi:MAG: hypothetical protein JWO52_5078, partial [Gammaproteobacteria bacterium]|nr:hypothetical protein [Gammaproteobacteria bacterium]
MAGEMRATLLPLTALVLVLGGCAIGSVT